ncbi:Hemolysin activation/secretion protein [Janthinobacterium sp. Marseille]|nr:POTRA domain-containing protein [Janthinobacterium sp. Marseille]ABR89806.1 Hemolysin activation/secretion protein [Janthinobacterium sp. Marseille]
MQRFIERLVAVCLTSALGQLALMPHASAADARSAGQGNPLDNLPKLEPSPAPTVTVDIQPQALDPAMQRLLASRIVPSRFKIAGVESIPFELVAAEFSPLTNREVTVAELLQAANKVTQIYQAKGYPLSFAFVPAQSFKDNIVEINVVEGYVSTVKIEGNPGASEERLRNIAEQLKADRPLSRDTFDRITSVLSLQPGMRIKATVRPPENTDGASEMTLEVSRKPVTTSFAVDTATSSLRGIFSVTENGLTPLGEQVTLSTIAPRGPSREEYVGLNYIQPIRWQGMLLQVTLSDYKGEPENQALTAQQLQSRYQTKTQRVSANLSYPLILKPTRSLTLSGGIYAVKNSSRYTLDVPAPAPSIEFSSDIRALSLELTSTEVSDRSSTQWSLGVYQGFDSMGARQVNGNIDLDFLRIKGSFTRSNQFANGYGITVSGMGQYSSNILPLSEQVSFGAKLYGLAYPVGEIAGDKGWGASLEFNRAFPYDGSYVKRIQPYVMADAAKVYVNAGRLAHSEIASVGTGVRFTDLRHYSLDLSIAQPVGEIPINASKRAPRLNLGYSYQLD